MEGDSICTKLVEAIMYDTTPIHYISMVSEQLELVVKGKQCFNADTGKVKINIPTHELHQKEK